MLISDAMVHLIFSQFVMRIEFQIIDNLILMRDQMICFSDKILI
jgi:hypothetical protein